MKQNYEIPSIAFSSLLSYKFIYTYLRTLLPKGDATRTGSRYRVYIRVHRRLIILARTSLQRENL